MKLEIETPTHLIDVNGLGARQDRADAGGRPADRRAGAQHRPGRRRARAARLRRALPRACSPARPGSCATRRRRRATCCSAPAAPTSTTPTMPCNKRQPGSGCAAIGGVQPAARGHRRRATPASPPTRATWRWPCARSTRRSRRSGPDGDDAAHPDRRVPPPAGRHAACRDDARARRADHGGDAAAARRRHAFLPQGARPGSYAFALVSVAAIVQPDGTRPGRAGRRRAQAVAGRGGRSATAARRQGRGDRDLLAGARPTHDNAFKVPLAERTLAAVLAEARG